MTKKIGDRVYPDYVQFDMYGTPPPPPGEWVTASCAGRPRSRQSASFDSFWPPARSVVGVSRFRRRQPTASQRERRAHHEIRSVAG
jgi:hypothetical protein